MPNTGNRASHYTWIKLGGAGHQPRARIFEPQRNSTARHYVFADARGSVCVDFSLLPESMDTPGYAMMRPRKPKRLGARHDARRHD